MTELTQEQRGNLEQLAAYLRSGNLQAEFDMGGYSDHCGSVGCAVGHGPYAGIPKNEEELWHSYSDRVFVESIRAESWMFDADWELVDNTPEGAAARIEWFLEHGVPDNWVQQLEGDAPLCYSTENTNDD